MLARYFIAVACTSMVLVGCSSTEPEPDKGDEARRAVRYINEWVGDISPVNIVGPTDRFSKKYLDELLGVVDGMSEDSAARTVTDLLEFWCWHQPFPGLKQEDYLQLASEVEQQYYDVIKTDSPSFNEVSMDYKACRNGRA